MFSHFAKVMCRPDDGSTDKLWGYNLSSGFATAFVGPGYFTLTRDINPGDLLVDYNILPPHAPEGWPAIKPNDRGLSNFVYVRLGDVLRGISQHVTIGRAYRRRKDAADKVVSPEQVAMSGRGVGEWDTLDNWFLLSRED